MQIFTKGKLCFYIFMEFCDLPKNVIIVPLENSMLWLWLAVIYRYGHWNYYVLDWFSQIMGPLCFWVWYLSLRLECMLKDNCFVVLFNKFTKDDFLSVLCTLSTWMFKNKSPQLMECELMLFVTKDITYLWGLLNSVSNSFSDVYSYKVVSSSATRKNKAKCFASSYGGCFENLNLLHVIVTLNFGDVLHKTKQKKRNKLWAVCSTD